MLKKLHLIILYYFLVKVCWKFEFIQQKNECFWQKINLSAKNPNVFSCTMFFLFFSDLIWTLDEKFGLSAEILRKLELVMSWYRYSRTMMSNDFKSISPPYTQKSSSHNRLFSYFFQLFIYPTSIHECISLCLSNYLSLPRLGVPSEWQFSDHVSPVLLPDGHRQVSRSRESHGMLP